MYLVLMYPWAEKSDVSFAPIGKPKISPIRYVSSRIYLLGTDCSTFVDIIRLDKIVNIKSRGNIWLNHSRTPALAHALTCAGNDM